MSEKKTMYSADKGNESWYCNDIDELLQEGLAEGWLPPEETNDIVIYSGTCEVKKASEFLGDIVDELTERAQDECGEVSSSWLTDCGNGLQKAMEECLDNWCDKNGQAVYFGNITGIKPIDIRILKIQGDDIEWIFNEKEAYREYQSEINVHGR